MASESYTIQAGNTAAGIINQGGKIHARDIYVNTEPQGHINIDGFQLPRLIETFRGRDEELAELESLFFTQNTKKVAICGLPGMGKSELAKQFADKCKKAGSVQHVFWVNAENLVTDNKEHIEQIRNEITCIYQKYQKYKCLFLFDNTVNRKSIFEFEPSNENAKHLLLVTSQVRDWQDGVEPLALSRLTPDAAVEVYRVILKDLYNEQDRSLYLELAEIVNNIPLGLQVTVAYVRQRMISVGRHFDLKGYVDEVTRNQDEYIDFKIPTNIANPYEKSLYGAILISINKLKNEENLQIRDLVLNVLFVCAYLDPEDITLDDLLLIPNIKQQLTQQNKDQNILMEALSLIVNYSVLNFDPNYDDIKIHRLVQEVLRRHLLECDPDIQFRCYSACLEALFNDTRFRVRHNVVLKYSDENIVTFYKIYLKYKHELFSNLDDKTLNHFLDYFIKWNCINSLRKLLDNLLGCNTFSFIMCIRRCFCIRTCTCNSVYYFELLHRAALYNNVHVMKLLIQEYNFNVNSREELNDTPLHTAAKNWNFEAIKYLVNQKADVDAKGWYGGTPLFAFFEYAPASEQIISDDVKEILGLLNFEHQTQTRDVDGDTLLHAAAFSINLGLMKLLVLEHNMDINCTNDKQQIPLHTAAFHWHFKSISFLIEHNADISASDRWGDTPLIFFIAGAWKHQHFKVDEVINILNLLGCQHTVNTTNKSGDTLLHTAARAYNADLVTLLATEYHLDVNAQLEQDRFTPLHSLIWAKRWGLIRSPDDAVLTVVALKRCGARLDLTDVEGRTPLQLAQVYKETKFLDSFLSDSESASESDTPSPSDNS